MMGKPKKIKTETGNTGGDGKCRRKSENSGGDEKIHEAIEKYGKWENTGKNCKKRIRLNLREEKGKSGGDGRLQKGGGE
jgi:hypothetical protein